MKVEAEKRERRRSWLPIFRAAQRSLVLTETCVRLRKSPPTSCPAGAVYRRLTEGGIFGKLWVKEGALMGAMFLTPALRGEGFVGNRGRAMF